MSREGLESTLNVEESLWGPLGDRKRPGESEHEGPGEEEKA